MDMLPKIVIGIVIVVVVYSIFQSGGFNSWKEDIVGNTVDTGKTIVDNAIDKGTEAISSESNNIPPSSTNVGKPTREVDCVTDSDCRKYIGDCETCLCNRESGDCYKPT